MKERAAPFHLEMRRQMVERVASPMVRSTPPSVVGSGSASPVIAVTLDGATTR